MRPRRKRQSVLLGITALLLLIVIAGAVYERRPQFFPYIVLQSGELLQVRFVQHAITDQKTCDTRSAMIARAMLANCSACRVIEMRCLDKLDPIQRKVLYGQPLDVPTMRMPEGVFAFFASSADLALQICRQSASQTGRRVPGPRDCYAAGVESLQLAVSSAHGPTPAGRMPSTWKLAAITGLAALGAFLAGLLILRLDRWHSWFSHDHVDGPQKFHVDPTPRIGGLALVAALFAGIYSLEALGWLQSSSVEGLTLLAMAAIPAFAGGMAEDVTKRVGVLARLMLTISGGVIAALLVGATLDRIEVPGLDTLLLHSPFFAIAFTAFAVGGVANAINIIDGYNGLVGGYAILVLGALAFVAHQVGDPVVLTASLIMAGGLAGFLVWNFPDGRVFLGDGGAYMLGFWLAELSVLLVARNPEVSPWFPMVLLAYPVGETVFSVYRKKFLRGDSPGHPDGLHFHMLIYKRLVRVAIGSRDPQEIMRRNSRVGPYIWIGTVLMVALSLPLWRNSQALLGVTMLYGVGYLWLYSRLVHLRAPKWLITT